MSEGASPQWIRGTTSRQAHADLPPGTVEEEHGREGFTGRASHLYRLHPPTGWRSIRGPLQPHALDTSRVATGDGLATALLDSRPDIGGIWLVGFRLGGTIAIVTAAGDDRVRGLATFAAPASLREWVRDPAWFLEYARRGGVLRTDGYPADPVAWTRAISSLDPVEAARRVAPRKWLVVHGSDDDVVDVDDARKLASNGGPHAELRIVQNGGHRLRHDPRAIAMLLGWLDRQQP